MPRLVLAILAAALLAACGHSDDPGVEPAAARASEVASTPGARGDLDVCSLLTDDEAAGFLGVAVTATDSFKIRTFQACEWINDSVVPNEVLQIGVFDFCADSSTFREAAGSAGATSIEEMPGIGDEAYWTGLHELYVRSGDRMFSVIPTTPGDRDQATEVARLVISRLR